MRVLFSELDIQFSIDHLQFHALNFVLERFLRSIPKHSHSSNSYEIHYIPFGYGQAKIDGILHDIVPNTLYVTGPHIDHEQVPLKEDPMVEYCIYFKIEQKDPETPKRNQVSYVHIFEKTKFWFGQDTQNLHQLMQQIFFELENQYTGYMTQVETLLQQLVVLLIRNYEEKQESQNHFKPSNLTDSKYLIIEECFLYNYQDITLDTLSERLGLSPRQTERLMDKYYGKTFLQKKTEAKMSAATLLLMEAKNSITDIANKTGYSSVEHFSNAFKRFYHISPRQYRKNSSYNNIGSAPQASTR